MMALNFKHFLISFLYIWEKRNIIII